MDEEPPHGNATANLLLLLFFIIIISVSRDVA